MRRRVAIAIALPVAAAGAVAAVVAVGGGGAAQPSRASAAGAGAHGTEVVARRTLVERELVDGTLGYDDARPALDRLGGTLTWLPEAGAVIRPGERLFAVDDRPVVLMDGTVPAWRDLEAGVSDGSDVLQLERNLGALGYDPGTIDDEFTSATAAAVVRWQEANDLPETGRVELGRVVFLPGPRRVASVTGSLGSSGGGGGASGVAWDGGAPAKTRAAVWNGDDAGFAAIADTGGAAPSGDVPTTTPSTTPTTPAERPPTQTTPSNGGGTGDDGDDGKDRPSGDPAAGDGRSGAPGGDAGGRDGDGAGSPGTAGPSLGGAPTVSGAPSGGGGTGGGGGDGGDGGGSGGSAGTEVLATTSTERVVTAQLDAADQALARVGRAAAVTLPSGRTVRGRITAVGTVATGSDDDQGGAGGGGGGDGAATLPVTIRLRSARGAGGLDEAPVSVALARTTRRNVLAVPVQALVARSGGGYAVRVRGRGGAEAAEVPVEPGLSADGWIELLDGAVRAGDRIEVPR